MLPPSVIRLWNSSSYIPDLHRGSLSESCSHYAHTFEYLVRGWCNLLEELGVKALLEEMSQLAASFEVSVDSLCWLVLEELDRMEPQLRKCLNTIRL